MQLEKKQFVDTTMGLVDHATQEAIVAEFSNIVLKSSDVAIFTADSDVNKDGKIDVVGVSEGTATLHVSADATYVDKNTGLSVTISKAAEISVTITAPPITAENTDLIVSFSAPVPVPVI